MNDDFKKGFKVSLGALAAVGCISSAFFIARNIYTAIDPYHRCVRNEMRDYIYSSDSREYFLRNSQRYCRTAIELDKKKANKEERAIDQKPMEDLSVKVLECMVVAKDFLVSRCGESCWTKDAKEKAQLFCLDPANQRQEGER
tara:strand:- start:140 stop:568 length:429 start_codon:yes stop_codon:yes gene_type:complete